VLFYFAREAAGALSARHSLRPLLLGAAKQFLQTSGESRREIAELYLKLLFDQLNRQTRMQHSRRPGQVSAANAIRDP
jgi:hypothetical protein